RNPDPRSMSQPTSDDANSAAVPSVSASASPLEGLRQAVLAAAEDLALAPGGAPGAGSAEGDGRREDAKAHAPSRAAITLERPKRAAFGDYSTNAALLLAPTLAAPPCRRASPPASSASRWPARAS